jgi:hypothetical protein
VKIITVFLMCAVVCYVSALGRDDVRKQGVKMSNLPATQQSAINLAIRHWYRQFKWKAQNELAKPIADASVATVRLGPLDEDDLIVTDQSGCSPSGNCSILVLRPVKSGYRVVLDGIGQRCTLKRARTKGLLNLELSMHGSATESTIKTYKFDGSRYFRAGCYNMIFAASDGTELNRPRITPCR